MGFSALCAPTALADVEYDYYRKVGELYVDNAWVTSRNGYTKIEAYIDAGTCNYYMGGYVEFNYYSEDNGWMEGYKYYPSDGEYGWMSVTADVQMSEYGTLHIYDNTYCY